MQAIGGPAWMQGDHVVLERNKEENIRAHRLQHYQSYKIASGQS